MSGTPICGMLGGGVGVRMYRYIHYSTSAGEEGGRGMQWNSRVVKGLSARR
jgi:hypothetical protein